MAALALLVVAGGVYALTGDDSGAPARVAQASATPRCTPSSRAPVVKVVPVKLPAPQKVVFQLLNGTDRGGLGKTVGDELAARSLKTTTFGNAPAPLVGDTVIAYGPGAEPSARLLAANILGVRLVGSPTPRGLTVTLGSTYTRLTTPAEFAAYVEGLAIRTPVPLPSPTCS